MMVLHSLAGVEQRVQAIESTLGIADDDFVITSNTSVESQASPESTGAFSDLLKNVMNDGKPPPPVSEGLTSLKGLQLEPLVEQFAGKSGIAPSLVKAVIKAESGGNPNAVSHAGALGLMQLMPATAKGLGVENPLNPMENIEGGTKYLGQLMKRYRGNKTLALAAYNAGSGAVAKYGGVPPYKETQHYIQKVLKYEENLK